MKKALIISDQKAGHENQSIAYCKHANLQYEILHVKPKKFLSKAISYLCDLMGLNPTLFEYDDIDFTKFGVLVCAGSSTYYTCKAIAQKHKIKTVAMMYPKGYKKDFDTIYATPHDKPKKRKNVHVIPANFAYPTCNDVLSAEFQNTTKTVGIVIGGSNKTYKMNPNKIQKQLIWIKERLKDHKIAITTSPRTPKDVEQMCEQMGFDEAIIYSKTKQNPIGDMLATCDYVFITSDSTSMISEAVSFGSANIEIIPLDGGGNTKYEHFIRELEIYGFLHVVDGNTLSDRNKKIDFKKYIK